MSNPSCDRTERPAPPRRRPRQRAHLTADEILAAIRRWHELHGEPPTMADWDPYRAEQVGQAWRIARYDAGDWPSVKSVRNHFGRLSNAVAVAGLVPRRQGQQRARSELALSDEVRLHLSRLRQFREGLPPADGLSAAIRDVARARRSDDPDDLPLALVDLAAAALIWAEAARNRPPGETPPRRHPDDHPDRRGPDDAAR